MTYTKRFKITLVSILSALCLFVMALGCFVGGFSLKASAASSTQAYLMHIDPDTDGVWYKGTTSKVAENRYYGKDGFVWFLINAFEDGVGQPVTDIEALNDMSPGDNKASHVELPSYVKEVKTDFKSTRDTPHGYWSNNYYLSEVLEREKVDTKTRYYKLLLPIDPPSGDEKMTNAVWHTRTTTEIDVAFNDDEWHQVSFYVGNGYPSYYSVCDTWVGILDEKGNVVADALVKDVQNHSWVTFAVKGSFTFLHKYNGLGDGIAMMSFDPIEEDPDVGVTNFTGNRTGVQTVNLSWENKTAEQTTKIYRREKGETLWNLLATTEAGATTYVDNDTNVASEYEYILGSGMLTVHDEEGDNHYKFGNIVPKTYKGNIPNESEIVSVKTAPYTLTKLEFDKIRYEFGKGKQWSARVYAYVQNESTGEYEPYPNATIQFSLNGDRVYSAIAGVDVANMNTDLGEFTTNAQGFVRFTYTPEYAGDYSVEAYLAPVPRPGDPEHGTAKATASSIFISSEDVIGYAPYLQSITDAIKPNDTVSVTGNYISLDDSFKVALAPNVGVKPSTFDESNEPANVRYLSVEDMLVTDSVYESGIMFIMPKDLACGSYDVWVRNQNGWSNGITLNAARPLYINQNTVYAGQQIEIVGRNFLVSDFGIGTEAQAYATTKIKLVEKGGSASYVVDVLQGVRYTAEESLLPKKQDIMHSNPYRLTFEVPASVANGEYQVYVAADGVDFRLLDAPQTLTVEAKKANNWDEDVFGSMADSTHVGNDPLDLRVSWAQHLNYVNIRTMTPNAEPTVNEGKITNKDSADALNSRINQAIADLAALGGGVVYFPTGTYYLSNTVNMQDNVILVGDGVGKTKILCVNDSQAKGNLGTWIKGEKVSNVGVARIEFGMYEYSTHNPDMIITLGQSKGGPLENNTSLGISNNKFISDCKFTFREEYNFVDDTGVRRNSRGVVSLSAHQNVLYQNNYYYGGNCGLYSAYSHEYSIVRNSYVYMQANSISFACMASYSFLENIYLEQNWHGHGYAIRNDAYIGSCFITKSGARDSSANIGEMILAEPPGGYFSTGYILGADARSFTAAIRNTGTPVNAETQLNYGNFAIYISEGKGAGQLRYFKHIPTNSYGNHYELADGEEDWEVIPDTTSIFSILCPMEGLTVYRFQGTQNKKSIFLYNQCFDSVVAECDLWDTEGIGVFSGDVNDTRFCPSRQIRIENNRIDGISELTGKGGIGMVTERSASRVSNGAQLMNIVVRGNVLTNTRPYDGTEIFGRDENGKLQYIGSSEFPDFDGIVVWTQRTEGQDTSGDARFIIIENNSVNNSQHGVYCDNLITGIVIRNNTIGKTDSGVGVTFYAPTSMHIISQHELYVDGVRSDLSGEFSYNQALPTLGDKDGKVFYGWSKTASYDPSVGATTKGLDSNTTLYALYGRKVVFDLGYERKNGSSEFNTIKVMDGYTVGEEVEKFGNPFRVGYEFGGWYLDKACTQQFDVTSAITENVTVYAKWTDKNAVADEEEPVAAEEPKSNLGLILGLSIGGGVVVVGGGVTALVLILRKKRK